jgi:hypothetical protein
MAVVYIALDTHLGIAVAAAKPLAQREAEALFEEALAVHSLRDEVRQRGPQALGAADNSLRRVVSFQVRSFIFSHTWETVNGSL